MHLSLPKLRLGRLCVRGRASVAARAAQTEVSDTLFAAPATADAPATEAPFFEVPDVQLPDVSSPTPSTFLDEAAKLGLPDMPRMEFPQVEPPQVPSEPSTSGVDLPAALQDAPAKLEALPQRAADALASTPSTSGAQTSESGMTRALERADDLLGRAEDAVGQAFEDMSDAVFSGTQGFVSGVEREMSREVDVAERFIERNLVPRLPPTLQGKADVILHNFEEQKAVFDEAPEVYLGLVALGAGLLAYGYYRIQFGGFAGMFKPVDLLERLYKEDNILVVDVRDEEDCRAAGVLDLKRTARGKAVAVPFLPLPAAIEEQARNKQELQYQLNASVICGLANVNAFTKIVVMDRAGETAKTLARAISKLGYRGYVAKGGFSAWKTSSLAIKEGINYEISAADLLSDKAEDFQEVAVRKLDELKEPRNAALATAGALGACTVVAFPHESFQFLGFLGLELTVLVWILSHESPQDALDDLSQSVSGSVSAVSEKGKSLLKKGQAQSPAAAAGQGMVKAEQRPSMPAMTGSAVPAGADSDSDKP